MSAVFYASSVPVSALRVRPLGHWVAAIVHQAVEGIHLLSRGVSGTERVDPAPAGSLPSFEAAALPHMGAAYNLARYLCRDPHMAEDIVQDAYLRAFKGWSEFRGGSVRAWLFTIVRNCHLSLREQSRRSDARREPRPLGPGEDIEDDPVLRVPAEGDPEFALLRQDEDGCVRRILSCLPDEAREILVLRDIEDCSYREISDVLGLPIGTVMSRLSRARRSFAAQWKTLMQGMER